MPSHIFTRVGRWEASVATNRRAADRAVAAGDPEQEFHASDYMVYAYLQTGQDGAARRTMDRAGRATGPERNAQGVRRRGDAGALRAGARRLGGGGGAAAAPDRASPTPRR